jgi:hypothetical protein
MTLSVRTSRELEKLQFHDAKKCKGFEPYFLDCRQNTVAEGVTPVPNRCLLRNKVASRRACTEGSYGIWSVPNPSTLFNGLVAPLCPGKWTMRTPALTPAASDPNQAAGLFYLLAGPVPWEWMYEQIIHASDRRRGHGANSYSDHRDFAALVSAGL